VITSIRRARRLPAALVLWTCACAGPAAAAPQGAPPAARPVAPAAAQPAAPSAAPASAATTPDKPKGFARPEIAAGVRSPVAPAGLHAFTGARSCR
jgi:hypothetical protein